MADKDAEIAALKAKIDEQSTCHSRSPPPPGSLPPNRSRHPRSRARSRDDTLLPPRERAFCPPGSLTADPARSAVPPDATLQRVEMMSMQSAMNSSKQNAMLIDKLDLIESMAMAQAMAVAKFQKEMNGRMEMSEGMLMSQSHMSSKNQKAINDRFVFSRFSRVLCVSFS